MGLYALSLAWIAPWILLAIAAVFGVKAGLRATGFKISVAALPVSLALNPLVQPLFLESRDAQASQALVRRFESSQLIGRPAQAVEAALGQPRTVRSQTPQVFTLEGRMVWEGGPQTVWEYKPLPYYWNGRRLQVFFENGTVSGFQANAN
jgi:hypothetical protein